MTWSSNSSSSITPSADMRVGQSTTFSQITISNIQIHDYQYYTCHGVSIIDSENLTVVLGGMWPTLNLCYLKILVKCKLMICIFILFSVLEIIELPESIIAFPGQDVILNCTVMGFPPPTVRWESTAFEGRVPSTNVIPLDDVTSVYQLTFTNISAANIGHSYTCVYANVFDIAMTPSSLIDEGSKFCVSNSMMLASAVYSGFMYYVVSKFL